MPTNQCRVCREREWPVDERKPIVSVCTTCDEGSCEWHGREYQHGFEHELCHETPDYSRIEAGRY